MTTVTYVCTLKNGEVKETKSYAEAQTIKANGGEYVVRYDEQKTY
jgi:hypothetical protein